MYKIHRAISLYLYSPVLDALLSNPQFTFSVKLQKVSCDLTDVQNSWSSIFHELTFEGLSTDF